MALADFDSPREWGADLDKRWPVRGPLRRCVIEQVAEAAPVQILELGIGDARILKAIREALPNAEITGVDREPALIDYAKQTLNGITLKTEDINEPGWWNEMRASFDLVCSFQTFHDLGGIRELRTVYERIYDTLVSGGRVLNTDFVAPQINDDPKHPRRFPVATHNALLQEIGYSNISCLRSEGDFACISAGKPG